MAYVGIPRLYREGGPGSGRHPKFGDFEHAKTDQVGSTKYHRFISEDDGSGRRTKITYEQNYPEGKGIVRENGGEVHNGTPASAEKFMNERYGIEK